MSLATLNLHTPLRRLVIYSFPVNSVAHDLDLCDFFNSFCARATNQVGIKGSTSQGGALARRWNKTSFHFLSKHLYSVPLTFLHPLHIALDTFTQLFS